MDYQDGKKKNNETDGDWRYRYITTVINSFDPTVRYAEKNGICPKFRKNSEMNGIVRKSRWKFSIRKQMEVISLSARGQLWC